MGNVLEAGTLKALPKPTAFSALEKKLNSKLNALKNLKGLGAEARIICHEHHAVVVVGLGWDVPVGEGTVYMRL